MDSCFNLFANHGQVELDNSDHYVRAAAYLRQARAMYGLSIDEIARALPKINRK